MPRNPDAYQPTAEEVLDVIRDLEHTIYKTMYRPNDLYVVDKYSIVEVIMGRFPVDNALIRPGYHGHQGRDTQINKVFSLSTLAKVLDQLVDEGELVKLRKPTWREEKTAGPRTAVSYHRSTSGYVTKDALDARIEYLAASKRNARRDKLMKQARDQIADKYAKQVNTAYEKLCADEGLESAREDASDEDEYSDDEEF